MTLEVTPTGVGRCRWCRLDHLYKSVWGPGLADPGGGCTQRPGPIPIVAPTERLLRLAQWTALPDDVLEEEGPWLLAILWGVPRMGFAAHLEKNKEEGTLLLLWLLQAPSCIR